MNVNLAEDSSDMNCIITQKEHYTRMTVQACDLPWPEFEPQSYEQSNNTLSLTTALRGH